MSTVAPKVLLFAIRSFAPPMLAAHHPLLVPAALILAAAGTLLAPGAGLPSGGPTAGQPLDAASTSPAPLGPLWPYPGASGAPAPVPEAAPPQPEPAVPEPRPLKFGMHASAFQNGRDAGFEPDYVQLWVGAWNLRWGFDQTDRELAVARDLNATPVVQLYYWGDDISRYCLDYGCLAGDTYKSQYRWDRLIEGMAQRLEIVMEGREAIIVLEPEFNKGDVGAYEPLDEALAVRAAAIRQLYPAARIALGFGGWAPQYWAAYDQAIDAADLMGIQLMRASSRNTEGGYALAATTVVYHATRLHELSGKPVLINDVALSTYPGAPYDGLQAQELRELFEADDQLRAAHVEGIVYRAYFDDPHAPLGEYFGEAERHMGLVDRHGAAKPALDAWLEGIQNERSAAAV